VTSKVTSKVTLARYTSMILLGLNDRVTILGVGDVTVLTRGRVADARASAHARKVRAEVATACPLSRAILASRILVAVNWTHLRVGPIISALRSELLTATSVKAPLTTRVIETIVASRTSTGFIEAQHVAHDCPRVAHVRRRDKVLIIRAHNGAKDNAGTERISEECRDSLLIDATGLNDIRVRGIGVITDTGCPGPTTWEAIGNGVRAGTVARPLINGIPR